MGASGLYPVVPGKESIFTIEVPKIKYGEGSLKELGQDAQSLGMTRVALFTDTTLAELPAVAAAMESLKTAGLDAEVYAQTEVEPTDTSFLTAAQFLKEGGFDGVVSVGGGSVIDTAKAANLFASHPADFLTYVNAPVGAAQPVPGPLMPHIACPTTSGTGSECTGITICDIQSLKIKSGIAHSYLRPSLALIDPTVTHTMPANVVASTGFDVLTHAIESYTARPFTLRDAPDSPAKRPMSQGANPYSDHGSLLAIELGGKYLVRAVQNADDHEARHALMFAATMAGVAFGNSGVHIPHAMSYAVAGLKHTYFAKDYPDAKPQVPHGISVTVNAPAAFRFTGPANPQRHWEAAQALGADISDVAVKDGGDILAERLIEMMKATDFPNGVGDVGYDMGDVSALAEGADAQQRLLTNAPRPVSRNDLESIFKDAMKYW